MRKIFCAIIASTYFLTASLAIADGFIAPAFVPGAYSPIASDLNPARALSNLIGKTSATVCIIGDSTATPGPTVGNNVDPTQIMWFFLQNKLRDDNPQITSWSFQNFAIPATNESNFTQTGTAIGVQLPSWFTTPGNTWMSYVQPAGCDVLFYDFGTNASTSGQTPGNSAAVFINTNLTAINAWTKVPNIIFITGKPTNSAIDTSDDANSSGHFSQAAFHRTFARSNAAGFTTFPNLQALGFGLVDLGRNFATQVYGFDPDLQFFQSKPNCIQNGLPLLLVANPVGSGASTACTTTHGDFQLTIDLPAQGGSQLFSNCAGALIVGASEYSGNYIRLNIGGAGGITPRYVLDGNISGAPSQAGSSVSTTAGNDVIIIIAVSSDRVQVSIQNGVGATPTLALDIIAPRFVGGAVGGTPIDVGCSVTPANSPTFNVTSFYEGIGMPTTQLQSPFQAYGSLSTTVGNATSCAVAAQKCKGGNGYNHIDSQSAMSDRAAIYSLNFHVPNPALAPFTVSTLPPCGSATQGELLMVTDASSPAYNTALTGGASTKVPAYCNGSAWVAH